MLPQKNRLPKEDVNSVMRYGARVTGPEITLIYKATTVIPRFAIVIGKKVDKRATARNRMRRMISESVRLVIPRLAPCDGVFVVKKQFEKSTAVALLSQANLI